MESRRFLTVKSQAKAFLQLQYHQVTLWINPIKRFKCCEEVSSVDESPYRDVPLTSTSLVQFFFITANLLTLFLGLLKAIHVNSEHKRNKSEGGMSKRRCSNRRKGKKVWLTYKVTYIEHWIPQIFNFSGLHFCLLFLTTNENIK